MGGHAASPAGGPGTGGLGSVGVLGASAVRSVAILARSEDRAQLWDTK